MWTITTNDNQKLIIIKSGETLDLKNLEQILSVIYLDNNGEYSSFNRFANLSGIKNIEVDINALVDNVKLHRQINPPKNDVKIAVYLPFGVTHSLAELYKLMMENDTFGIMVSSSLAKCAAHIDVDQSTLNG